MNRRGAGYGDIRRGARAVVAASDPDGVLLQQGASIVHWWEPRGGQITTLNGANIARVHDVRETNFVTPTRVYLDQATAANQPARQATSGPNGTPRIHLQDGARFLEAATAIAAGGRNGIYAICTVVNTANFVTILVRNASAQVVWQLYQDTTPATSMLAGFSGGAQAIAPITDPADSTAARLYALRPLSTGALAQINNTTTTPALTGTDTLRALTTTRIGSSANAGGTCSALIITTEPTAAINAAVLQYAMARFGVP